MTMPTSAAADPSAELRLVVREALISLEAASMAAEMLGKSDERSQKADQASVVDFVDAALAAVRKLDASALAPPKTIFPNASMASAWCERNPLSDGLCYQIHRDGGGRCTVSINAPLEFL
jgi:hypothetical protein